MSAQVWMGIGIAGVAAAAALIVVAVLLFIRWRIPHVVGELSGRTEKKQIRKMEQAKIDAANKVNIRPQAYEQNMFAPVREQQETPPAPAGAEQTDVLGEEGPANAATDMLLPDDATDVLEIDPNATTILSGADTPLPPPGAAQPGADVAFEIVKRVAVVHTKEVIES